ncbi:DUF6090 family protein [Christiangramia sp. SM2212]|uniref:DUF6090 family protein n=1 Tax=Christiangramia sediminicola TaxID=3073267 RepID=A0ABU1ERG2_9FLAO|nr:DUF6090 family protein [Christiangramia sp. SM2212]MDR5590981.1 DUF6090 family protein [Christiangramia sp. SM2212]
MIKFFRNIRRRLLRENRFTRYLIYAIGEIILVVIGILIALQVNNWNESRKTAKAEQGYLKSLKSDFYIDIKAQDSIIDILNVKIANLDSLTTEVKKFGENINYNKALAHYSYAFGFPEFVSNDHTLETLKSNGNVEAVSDENLRVDLLDYYDDVEVYYREQTAATEIMLDILINSHLFDLMGLREEKYLNQEWFSNLTKKGVNEFTNKAFAYTMIIYSLRDRLQNMRKKAMQIDKNISISQKEN